MPNWGEVLTEINQFGIAREMESRQAFDVVRKKYIKKLNEYTGRNVIAYYSSWLQKPDIEGNNLCDDDKNGFMMAVSGMDCSKGLDLILHTPGGDIAATESIIDYLHRKFMSDNQDVGIRVVIPQIAMSAGTMIACSGRSILMGKQSNLGPIDPQLRGLPAHGVVGEFRRAHEEIKEDPTKIAVWQFIINKYHPTFLSECENAIALSEEFVMENLAKVMFRGDADAKEKSRKAVEYLTSYNDRKTHGRHISIDECKDIGLIIEDLESDQYLQDLILTIHHCYMHVLANTPTIKIIENHLGAAMVRIQVPAVS